MLRTELDHLVITCGTLEAGVASVEAALGVSMSPGGKHERMGTHNALLKVGGRLYLEVIAVDPGASPVHHPRWFQMDDLTETSPAKLSTWVVRTSNIDEASEAIDHRSGVIREMSRGTLNWKISIPQDGMLIDGGILPAFIQWPEKTHPAERLPDSGVVLKCLTLHHPRAAEIASDLHQVGFSNDGSCVVFQTADQPLLTATLETPHGLVVLGTC